MNEKIPEPMFIPEIEKKSSAEIKNHQEKQILELLKQIQSVKV